MKRLKKALSLTLALALSLSLAVPAFAAEYEEVSFEENNGSTVVTFSAAKYGETVSLIDPRDDSTAPFNPLILQPGSQVDVTYGELIGEATLLIFSLEQDGKAAEFTGIGKILEAGSVEKVFEELDLDDDEFAVYQWSDEESGDTYWYWLQIGENPAAPAEPEQPAAPAEPEQPAAPAESEQPAAPAEPEQPAEPAAPAEPEQPAAPAESEQPAAPAGAATYVVDNTKGALNIRSGPGTEYKIAAHSMKNGAKFQVVEIKGDWGKLANGSGWAYLPGAKKVEAPAQPEKPVVLPEGAVAYTVKKGDTVSSITVNFYGDNTQRQALMAANKEAFKATKGKLVPGMVLTIPATLGKAARIPAPVAGEGESLYTVKLGDTLGKIAAAQYGKTGEYKAIFERNKDRLESVNMIYEGQVIVLPAKK